MKKLLSVLLILCCSTLMLQGAFCSPESLESLSAKVTETAYPDADSALLYDRETVTVEPSGASRNVDDMALKILTEKGRREHRVFRFSYSDQFESVKILRCAILRGGKTIAVDVAANSRVSVESSQMSANIYDPHHKMLTLTLPDVRIGDVILLTVEEHNFKPRMKGVFCDLFGLQGTQPVLYYEVEVDTPETLPLQGITVKNKVVPVQSDVTRKDGRIVYRWSMENVPQVIPEPGMPPVYLCAQRLLVSTAKDYAEVSRWYEALCRPRLAEVSPEMKKAVEDLTKNAKTPREKADAIFRFVSQKIRYMGITDEKEAPGYEPHPVKMTFEKRYGVCRDKAALLVAMLQLSGLEAHPVLFFAGEPKDAEVPNNYFNHAVAAVKIDGAFHLMDPTYENTREWFPAFESEMSYLVASPQGDELRLSPSSPAAANGITVSTRGVLKEDGQLQCESTIAFRGTDDLIYRDTFARKQKEFQRDFFSRVLQKSFPGAGLDELELEPKDLRDMSEPFFVKMKFHGTFSGDGSLRNLPLPLLGSRIGITAMHLGGCLLKKRQYPLTLEVPSSVKEELELALPQTFQCVAPRHCEESGKVLDLQCAVEAKNGKVRVRRNITLRKKRVQPEEYAELKQSLAALTCFDRGGLLLKTSQDCHADMEILRSDTIFELLGEDSAVIMTETEKKILTYAGIKSGSELRLAFNPAQEEVLLLKGEVVDPDGAVHPLSAKEQNLMDAPGADSAPAYSSNKILAVSFPGVRQGSLIRYTVKRVYRNLPGIAWMQCFAAGVPIRLMTLRVKDRTGVLQQQLIAPAGTIAVSREADGTAVYCRQNVPAVKSEAHAPALVRFAPSVLLGNTTPQRFAEKLSAALEKQTEKQPKSEAQAKMLVKDCKSTEEKVRAIRDFVAVKIRKAGPALNDLPYTAFSPADATLARGYGNSADCAILLVSMLRAAGLPAEFLAVSDLPLPEERGRLLSPLLFTKILVRSNSYILNASSQYAPLSIRPFAPGAVTLTLPGGRWERGYPDAMLRRSFKIRVKEDSSAEIQCTMEYLGKEGEGQNRAWSEMTPARRAQYFEALLTSLSHTADMVRAPVWCKKNARGNSQMSYTVRVPDFCSLDGAVGSFALPGFRNFTSRLPGAPARRTTPIDWRFPAYVMDSWEVTLPERWNFLRLPENHTAVLGGITFLTRVTREKDSVVVRTAAVPAGDGSTQPNEAMFAPQNASLLNQWKKTFEPLEQRIILVQTDKEK